MLSSISHRINPVARSVRSIAAAMPKRTEMEAELQDAEAANQRGYFLPDEDERLSQTFAHYLSLRSSLLEAVESIQPIIVELDRLSDEEQVPQDELWEVRLTAFITGFTAAAILMRAATFIIDLAKDRPVVKKKLDEPEDRYGIQAKSFTFVYKNLGSSRKMWRFQEALMFYESQAKEIDLLREEAVAGPLITILDAESVFFTYRKRDFFKRKLHYRLHSFKRRHISGYRKIMFHFFKLSGSAIAELKQPFVKPIGAEKRVNLEVIKELEPQLQAGDIFITRHDDALSNLFLPGFWPHAALYIGTQEERDTLGIKLPKGELRETSNIRFLEAKKDGVLFRTIEETLQVDAFTIIRPLLNKEHVAEALNRAISHEGKLYDFLFDFSQSNRLACTAVVYRAYHGVGPVSFSLIQHAGRSCLSAEELIAQATESANFYTFADYGVEADVFRFY